MFFLINCLEYNNKKLGTIDKFMTSWDSEGLEAVLKLSGGRVHPSRFRCPPNEIWTLDDQKKKT